MNTGMYFKCVYHCPNWLLTAKRDILIASQNAKPSYTKKSHSSKKVPKIYSKKIMAAVCNQFSSKADLIHIISGCNNSAIPYFMTCSMCYMSSLPDILRKRIVWKIQILFRLQCPQITQWFIWQATKWEMQIVEEHAQCILAEEILIMKRLQWKIRYRINVTTKHSVWYWRESA